MNEDKELKGTFSEVSRIRLGPTSFNRMLAIQCCVWYWEDQLSCWLPREIVDASVEEAIEQGNGWYLFPITLSNWLPDDPPSGITLSIYNLQGLKGEAEDFPW